MAYRHGDRHQMSLLPTSIEEYVGESDPVRVYDAFVEGLDFGRLGIEINPGKIGNSEYDPRSMVKLLVYGYSYGVKSSRKLERECYHNIAFIWLMGGLKPDHKTIAEFRRRNKGALKKILRQCAQLCLQLKLISGNVLFVDGTKIRANAARSRTHDRAYYEKLLVDIDQRIAKLLEESERADRQEKGQDSYLALDKELSKSQKIQNRVKEVLESFQTEERKQINLSDPDCAIMRSVQGSHASYNVQSVVDDQYGLIIQAEAVRETSDVNQFARQIEQANELLEKPCAAACADAGYADTDELEKIDGQGIKVVVPSQRQALHEEEGPFSKSHFTYDQEQDCYFCPEGQRLSYQWTDKDTGKRHYQITKRQCQDCRHYGQCTTSKKGRKIIRLHNEETKERLEALYQEAASQEIYKRRKMRAEHPFGHIKRNLKTDAFLLRGRDGVQAETSLLATCFNVARLITILGVSGLMGKLASRMLPVAV